MKIVIEIDDDLYNEILSRKYSKTRLEKAVANGTPLPKGHGRIIDESKITKCYMPVNQLDVRGIRTDAPTIIEGSNSNDSRRS